MPNVAVLIDAENVLPVFAEQIMTGAANVGTVVVREIYGTAAALTTWTEPVLRYALHPNLTIKASKGKNTSDIALAIGAMDLMMMEHLDTVVLVSSDSDFSGLSVRLRSQGIEVTGMGTEKANPLWRTACTNFVVLQPPPTPAQLRAQALKAARQNAQAAQAQSAGNGQAAKPVNGQAAAPAQSAGNGQAAKPANGQTAAPAQNAGNGQAAKPANGQAAAQAQNAGNGQAAKPANGQAAAQAQNAGNGQTAKPANGQAAAQAQSTAQATGQNGTPGQSEQKNGQAATQTPAQGPAPQGTPATEKQSGATHAGRVAIIRDFIAKQLAENNGRMALAVLFQGLNAVSEYVMDQRRSSRKPLAYLKWLFGDVYEIEDDTMGGSWISVRSPAQNPEAASTESLNGAESGAAQGATKAEEATKTENTAADQAAQPAGEAQPAPAEKPQPGKSAWAQQTAAKQQELKAGETKPEGKPAQEADKQQKNEPSTEVRATQKPEQPASRTEGVQDAKKDETAAAAVKKDEQQTEKAEASQPKKRGRKPGTKNAQKKPEATKKPAKEAAKQVKASNAGTEKPAVPKTQEKEVSLHEIGLPNRSVSSLLAAGYQTLNEVTKLSDEQLMGIKNVGTITVDQIRKAAKEAGIEN